jgi:hypothetical protein
LHKIYVLHADINFMDPNYAQAEENIHTLADKDDKDPGSGTRNSFASKNRRSQASAGAMHAISTLDTVGYLQLSFQPGQGAGLQGAQADQMHAVCAAGSSSGQIANWGITSLGRHGFTFGTCMSTM